MLCVVSVREVVSWRMYGRWYLLLDEIAANLVVEVVNVLPLDALGAVLLLLGLERELDEDLLQFLVHEVDAQLLESVFLFVVGYVVRRKHRLPTESTHDTTRHAGARGGGTTYTENLETVDVENTGGEGLGVVDVHGVVDSLDDVVEHARVEGLRQGVPRVDGL